MDSVNAAKAGWLLAVSALRGPFDLDRANSFKLPGRGSCGSRVAGKSCGYAAMQTAIRAAVLQGRLGQRTVLLVNAERAT
jgi:hypothetical protein